MEFDLILGGRITWGRVELCTSKDAFLGVPDDSKCVGPEAECFGGPDPRGDSDFGSRCIAPMAGTSDPRRVAGDRVVLAWHRSREHDRPLTGQNDAVLGEEAHRP